MGILEVRISAILLLRVVPVVGVVYVGNNVIFKSEMVPMHHRLKQQADGVIMDQF